MIFDFLSLHYFARKLSVNCYQIIDVEFSLWLRTTRYIDVWIKLSDNISFFQYVIIIFTIPSEGMCYYGMTNMTTHNERFINL